MGKVRSDYNEAGSRASNAAARGGLLHDLYLYDARDRSQYEGNQCFAHPKAALRNARALLAEAGLARPRVVLLSSRYHLARCALLARWLGYDYALCAAEPRLDWRPATLWRIACEAAWVCWIDVGARWARLAGHRGMLAKVS